MAKTPLMDQYSKIKTNNPDAVLLFRVGDFYETFEDDAKTASRVLGITLTKRSNGAAGEVPLAGFPHHAIDTYLPRLVRAGYRVAICEQLEDPKLAKGIVKRDVIEVVTPGVALSDKLLDHKKNNFLLSVFIKGEYAGIAFCDISTGEFGSYEIPVNRITSQIMHINPSEIIISKKQRSEFEAIISKIGLNIRITRNEDWLFDYDYCHDLLLNHFKTVNLKGFGIEQQSIGICAAGAILQYLNETQKVNLPHINKISAYNYTDYMTLDNSTKRNLEINFTMQTGEKEGSLLGIIDKTRTSMGARLLKKWISAPLKKIELILKRQECVEKFATNNKIRENLFDEISEIGDLERLIARICTGKATPRELINLKLSLKKLPLIKQILENINTGAVSEIYSGLKELDHIVQIIEKAINDEPPASVSDGNVVKKGYNTELDKIRSISRNAKSWISDFQQNERERSGISSLKVSYNKVFGYYIEISNAQKAKVPSNYERKQTLVNGERYITPELKEYEETILNAEDNTLRLESQIFNEVRNFISADTQVIQENAKYLAILDCFLSMAQCAVDYNYTKPEVNETKTILIKEGRHPVVEQILPPGEKFTSNDCFLSDKESQILMITGPNMAGKSVYLRQTGLIVLMAQMGSYVPAKYAEIGIVDRIYTRVGASDNISAGESTFLVEMQEAANILNNATSKSLILLDEIGRGTSTFDGISIAWAITEYLHENPEISAKTLFATHYHELNEMAELFPKIKNFKVDVRESGDKVLFLHKVVPGGADHSYGIHVAQMAGLPDFITKRAKEILYNLESKELTPVEIKKAKMAKNSALDEFQISLFEFEDDRLRKEIKELKIETMTPIEALNTLNELKRKINEEQ